MYNARFIVSRHNAYQDGIWAYTISKHLQRDLSCFIDGQISYFGAGSFQLGTGAQHRLMFRLASNNMLSFACISMGYPPKYCVDSLCCARIKENFTFLYVKLLRNLFTSQCHCLVGFTSDTVLYAGSITIRLLEER